MSEKLERAVVEHYGSARLGDRILDALKDSGIDPDHLRIEDLAPADEFHVGGRAATEHALAKIALSPEQQVLDVGSGVGGAARYIAKTFGCRVTGIDLTPDFVEAAEMLTRLTGLADQATFRTGSALAMPFEDASFDAAVTLHVAMNISDRAGLYREVARVLKPGAPFLVYDVMQGPEEGLDFPLPWATSAETSHLETPEGMRALLEAAGFAVDEVEDRTQFGIQFLRQRLAAAASGQPPTDLRLVIGPDMRPRFENLLVGLEKGAVAPVVMVARKR